MSKEPHKMPVLTHSQAAAAQTRFDESCAAYEKKRESAGRASSPHDFFVYRELYAAAFGAPAVEIVADPR